MLENMHEQMEGSDVEALEKKKKQEDMEDSKLAKKWASRIESARKHYEKHHKRFKYNRKMVAGFNYSADPQSSDFYRHRANLIHGSIEAILPNVYARNPEISAIPTYKSKSLKKFCETIEKVTNVELEKANLKGRAKSAVKSSLTCSIGVLKVIYQRDIAEDPIIKSRIEDAQDDIKNIERLMLEIEDEANINELEAKKEEYQNTMNALSEQLEVIAAEGVVIDKVFPENLLVDPSITDFSDYEQSSWMCQVIPMKKGEAEGLFKKKLDKAKTYEDSNLTESSSLLSTGNDEDDKQIAILEIWDKTTHCVYTMADGCDFWLKDPYSPDKVGQRWYPFFLLPYQIVDGQFIGPSIVDLTEKLQEEHNKARDRYNAHRDLCLPGYIADSTVSEKSINRFSVAGFGEIVTFDSEGKPVEQSIRPKQYPPIDPVVYDTGNVRQDWEMVTGLQDASRSTVVDPKTATEAQIMQQSLSGRVGAFRDQVEDWIQDIAQYCAQILVQELTPDQVERIMGPPVEESVYVDGVEQVVSTPSFDWPQVTSKEDVFGMVEMRIRAGTTGAPDKMEQQELWQQLLPIIQNLIQLIAQAQMGGMNADPVINLLKETIKRFDERLDPEQFIPKPQTQSLAQGLIDPGQPQSPQDQQIPGQSIPGQEMPESMPGMIPGQQAMPEQQMEELMLPEQY